VSRLDRADPLGATRGPGGAVRFRLWAPRPTTVTLERGAPLGRRVPMEPLGEGYRGADVDGVSDGTRYTFRLDGGPPRPDPASRSQPDGVAGPSEVVSPEKFAWTDRDWKGVARPDLVFYELHTGTFSPSGTFEGVLERLGTLVELGVTSVELMPVAAFPGTRNWGYDGVFPFAVQGSYGGIAGLQRLADACHARGLALTLDIVPNHVGPEGNALGEFGPYFTEAYHTPWGAALNFDGADSDPVRRYFCESATYLVAAAHLDGLRVDAIHAIIDPTARPFLAEFTEAVGAAARPRGWPVHLIAESALNDPRVVAPREAGGLGFDAMWNDDFHHAIHARLTGERDGYYVDFGAPDAVRAAFLNAFVLSGQYSAYRRRRHGTPATGVAADRFVVCVQDHDQVGNRPRGERLGALVPFEGLKLAAGALVLSPYLPLLFMGEEYGETAPFLYFTSHEGAELARAVRDGRRAGFPGRVAPQDVPDPQDVATFERSRLVAGLRERPGHRELLALYRELLALRREVGPRSRWRSEEVVSLGEASEVLVTMPPQEARRAAVVVYHFGRDPLSVRVPFPPGEWRRRLDSADRRWAGPGGRLPDRVVGPSSCRLNPLSFGVFERAG
jgi:maltooligosyltrehalose trehalohydrolase